MQQRAQVEAAFAEQSRLDIELHRARAKADPAVQAFHEAIALGQGAQRADHAAIEQAKITGALGNLHARAGRHQPVETAHADALDDAFIAAIAPHRVHHVVAGPPAPHHLRHARQRMLKIGVDQQHGVADGGINARGQRCLLAEIARQFEIQEWIPRCELGHHGAGVIAAAIIDDHDLKTWCQCRQCCCQRRHEALEIACFIERRHHAGQSEGRRAKARRPGCGVG